MKRPRTPSPQKGQRVMQRLRSGHVDGELASVSDIRVDQETHGGPMAVVKRMCFEDRSDSDIGRWMRKANVEAVVGSCRLSMPS
eukprot:2170633-Karenia_brevis.AAC.1